MASKSAIDLEPFMTRDDRFYVYCEGNLVACVAKVSDGWQSMEPKAAKVTYKSAIMAAFADANMASPKNWLATTS